MSFCSLKCWDVHVPVMNHREAWAEEKTAPTVRDTAQTTSAPSAPTPRAVGASASPNPVRPPAAASRPQSEKEILVVASKVKDYIRDQSGFNTSAGVLEVLSDYLRRLSDEAIEQARSDGRKTVMDRDFPSRPRVHSSGSRETVIRRRST
ncbi:MAG: hypothetical protein KDD69_15805 [Bdellovibrionales bacterium]|nr:hypothetical protein [Bdellovibrionales bacterium]